MSRSIRRLIPFLCALAALAAAAGCDGQGLEGTYHSDSGQTSIELKSSTAVVTYMGDREEVSYDVSGDTITIRLGPDSGLARIQGEDDGTFILRRNSDGTLSGPFEKFSKGS